MEVKLNFVRQMRAFTARALGVLSPASIAIYVALFSVANDASSSRGVNQTVTIDNERLMRLAGIGNKRTLAAHRKQLIEGGFITYVAGGNFIDRRRACGRYSLVKLYG